MPVDRADPEPTLRSDTSARLRSRPWAWMAIYVGVAASLGTASDIRWTPMLAQERDWIDARLEPLLPRERFGIPHCEAMVGHQLHLAGIRDSLRAVIMQGQAGRSACLDARDSTSLPACLANLQPLRERVRTLHQAETGLQDSVRYRASRCDASTFKAWQQLQELRNHSDSTATPADSQPNAIARDTQASYDQLVEFEFASVWNQERQSRYRAFSQRTTSTSPTSTAFRSQINSYLGRRGSPTPNAKTHFLLAVLDHREGRDDLALARLRRIPARDSASAWKGPVAMLYGQILAPTSPDSATPLLLTARLDSSLRAPAEFLLARIELEKQHPAQALEYLADYLDHPGAPSPGNRLQAIELTALALVRLAEAPYHIHSTLESQLPTSARDTIAFQVAKTLLAQNAAKECIEILSSFQITYPGTLLGEDARAFLSQVRRQRPGIVVRGGF